MWLSEKAALGARESEPASEVGVVTAGGQAPSVMLGGEKRRVEIASPKGIYWAPARGDQVVVTRCGDELFVTGALGGAPEVSADEVCLKSGESSVRLYADGRIELSGEVNVKGTLLLNGVDIRALLSPL